MKPFYYLSLKISLVGLVQIETELVRGATSQIIISET